MFKNKNSCNGQIFPVLLVCIAGLLALIAVTKATGKAKVAKSCASNAADAAALAAASYEAGAFNQLVFRNKDKTPPPTPGNTVQYMNKENTDTYYKELKDYFEEMRKKYEVLYNASVKGKYAENAINYCHKAEKLMKQAMEQMVKEPDCTIWAKELTAADLNKQAAAALYEASKQLGAFSVYLYFMHEFTDYFRSVQMENFGNADSFMQGGSGDKDGKGNEGGEGGAFKQARETGQTYGFNNGTCLIPGGGGDDLNFQIGTGSIFEGTKDPVTGVTPTKEEATYDYEGGSLSVKCELPKIQTYQLFHTKWNFPQKHMLHAVPLDIGLPIIYSIPPAVFLGDPFNREAAALFCDYDDLPQDMTSDRYYHPDAKDDPATPGVDERINGEKGKDGIALGDYFVGLSYALRDVADLLSIIATGKLPAGTESFKPEFFEGLTADSLFTSNKSVYEDSKYYAEACEDGYDCTEAYAALAVTLADLKANEEKIRVWLNKISFASLGNEATIPVFIKWNNDIWNNVWQSAGGAESFKNAKEVQDYKGVNDLYPGLMIHYIDSVTLDGAWEVKCTVTSKTAGTVSSTSNSTATFDQVGIGGAAIGQFKDEYYPEITSTG